MVGNLRWAFNNGTRFARNFHDSLLDIFFLHTLGMDHEAFLLYTLTNFSKSLLFYAIRILRGAFRLPRGNARKYPTPPLRIRVDTSRAKASSRVVNVFISTLNVDYIRGCPSRDLHCINLSKIKSLFHFETVNALQVNQFDWVISSAIPPVGTK